MYIRIYELELPRRPAALNEKGFILSVRLSVIDLRVYDRGLWAYVTLGIPLEDDGIPVYQNVWKEIRLK